MKVWEQFDDTASVVTCFRGMPVMVAEHDYKVGGREKAEAIAVLSAVMDSMVDRRVITIFEVKA